MCGIFGSYSFGGTKNLNFLKIKESLKRRGPDEYGEWISQDSKVKFIHSRLSILDLSKNGNQPMVSSNGRYVITYNGEIYNFQKLKKKN